MSWIPWHLVVAASIALVAALSPVDARVFVIG